MPGKTSFEARFSRMVEALWAHPQIEVYDVEVRPPASEEAIRAAEEEVGSPLPAAVRAFYAAHDGVFLEWGVRGRTYASRTGPFGTPDDHHPPGCINLLPVAQAMTPGWESDGHVNEIQPAHQERLFGRRLDPQPPVRAVCVDNFARFHHGDLVFGPAPVMVVSSDYGADMDSSHFMDFDTYLDATLGMFGANRYTYGLGAGRWQASTRIAAWTRAIDLGALVAELAEA